MRAMAIAVALWANAGLNAAEATTAPDNSYVWWEAEKADSHTFPDSQSFAPMDEKQRGVLSAGAWLQTDRGAGAAASWTIDVPEAGEYFFWTRKFWFHGPFKWHFNDQPETLCSRKCSLADGVDMRQHVCANWVPLGKVALPKGKNTLRIKLEPDTTAAGFDCWLLTKSAFTPSGPHKPGEKYNRSEPGWFNFEPDTDKYTAASMFDFRSLNQKRAGDEGFLKADGLDIVFEKTGRKVKFWGVTAGCDFGDDHQSVDYLARKLAKYGVNMVRVHSPIYDKNAADPSTIDMAYLDKLHYFVAALAKEGIYTKLSFYFPLWCQITKGYQIPGYYAADKSTFALIYFHPRMQQIYKNWAKALLTTVNPYTGKTFAADPAVAIVEIVNEDGLFFWTFLPRERTPIDATMYIEKAFGDWLKKKRGSLEKAVASWGAGGKTPDGDNIPEGRIGLYHPGFLGSFTWATEARNQRRAEDQLEFMVQFQRGFYASFRDYFRNELGVKCLISASNWHTVDAKNLGALEKYTYTACDIIDRHGYFGPPHQGNDSSWSVKTGHTYKDRSGMTEPDSLTKELQYGKHPHMISEYNYPTPNRFRSEGVYMAATYGALAGTDAFFYFAMHNPSWSVTNTKFPVYTPVVMGQFPAFSYIYREGIVKEGPVVADLTYSLADLLKMKGTSLVETAYMDELRKKDILAQKNTQVEMPNVIDPLAYYVGQVRVDFTADTNDSKLVDLAKYIDRKDKTIKSATGQLFWDWGKGYSSVNTPRAQGVCGFLGKAGTVELGDVAITGGNEYGSIIVVAIDGKPIKESGRILVQVMTEDRNYGFTSKKAKDMNVITDIGGAPLLVKNLSGKVTVRNAAAGSMKIHALDFNGYEKAELGTGVDGAMAFELRPDVLYYMLCP